MGLSFLLMSVIRNRPITFVIILGYIGIALFLKKVQARYYYLLIMAFNIPMLISDITSMGNLKTRAHPPGNMHLLGIGLYS